MDVKEASPKPWTAQEILDTLTQHREELRRFGVCKIGLFGSHSRGEAGPESDIDILVTLDPVTFDNYANLINLLEDTFGRKVDLVPEENVRSVLRPYIMGDVVFVQGV